MAKRTANRGLPVFDRFITNSDLGKFFLRVPVGTLMLFHGLNKLQHGYGFITPMLLKAKLPGYLSHGILIGELVAPLFMVLGIYTRPAALLQVFVMAMAIYLVHARALFSFSEHGGYSLELQVLYLFGALAVFFFGAGRYSIIHAGGIWR
ncbi:MAG: DoxX family protein [Chlorobiaceae bacterium]|nr:DoxX family protein [Chlorobiaceae bacterium]